MPPKLLMAAISSRSGSLPTPGSLTCVRFASYGDKARLGLARHLSAVAASFPYCILAARLVVRPTSL